MTKPQGDPEDWPVEPVEETLPGEDEIVEESGEDDGPPSGEAEFRDPGDEGRVPRHRSND